MCWLLDNTGDVNCHTGSAPGTMTELVIGKIVNTRRTSMTLLLMSARHRSGDTKTMESASTLSWHYHHALHRKAPHPTHYHHCLSRLTDAASSFKGTVLTCYKHSLQHGSNNCGIICEQQETMTRMGKHTRTAKTKGHRYWMSCVVQYEEEAKPNKQRQRDLSSCRVIPGKAKFRAIKIME